MTHNATVSHQPQNLFNAVTFLNLGLLAVCAGLLFYYVLSANGLAAANYHISALRDDLVRATDQQTALTSLAARLDSIESVSSFALAHQMVVAKDISYIFENGNVALVR